MSLALREQVRQRAHDACEYCKMPQALTQLPHEIDHVRAQKHRGPTELHEPLALLEQLETKWH